jgi:hypothetical protein
MTWTIFVRLAFGIAVSVAAYLALAFVHWNLLWAEDLPNYSEADRAFMLIVGGFLNGAVQILVGIARSA